MDSSNMLDLHYPHDELHLHPSPLCWIQNPLLNGDEQIEGSSDGQHIDPCFASEMVQDLGFHWTSHGSAQQLHLAKIKHEQQTLLHELNSYHFLPPFANGSFGFDPLSSGMFPQALDQISRTDSSQIPSIYRSPVLNSFDYGVQHHLEGSTHVRSSISLHEMHPSVNGVAEYKRANGSLDQPKALKKARFEHGHSLSPFKVRKEKLGDRIAALQQLVAPFGKTDTASVLMESIGYIKFLQEQVETLSVPYMRSKSDKKLHTTEEVSSEERDEAKMDLKSRGLCLVPLSCTSYVTNDHTAWSPPNLL